MLPLLLLLLLLPLLLLNINIIYIPNLQSNQLPSAMRMQIHLAGNQAHLAMDGHHLCSQNSAMSVGNSGLRLNKEITPKPYKSG